MGKTAAFFVLFIISFLTSLVTLASFDLLPNPAPGAIAAVTPTATTTPAGIDTMPTPIEDPMKIVAPTIGLSATIKNPTSTKVDVLDAALLSGAVRYPTSAKLGESGNVVVFGHSSYLPIVNNQAYKTFDGIQKLAPGDVLMVYSSTRVYTYQVQSVEKANAESGAIPLAVIGHRLTLSTCDSFGKKSDRFVVTAEFVGSVMIST